jgi:hypothetical protein
VGNEGQCQRVDAGIAAKRLRRKFGQLLVVSRRQISANLAQGIFDDVEVVDEPLGVDRSKYTAVAMSEELIVGAVERTLVFKEPSQQRTAGRARRRKGTFGREQTRVTLSPFKAE